MYNMLGTVVWSADTALLESSTLEFGPGQNHTSASVQVVVLAFSVY